MKIFRKALPIILCLFLLLAMPLGTLAAGAGVYEDDVFDVSGAVQRAGNWLKETLPEAAVGNELEVLALLRGGFERTDFDYMQGYLAKLKQHYTEGGMATQTLSQTAQQALVLTAAGINPAEFDAGIAPALQSAEAINTEGFSAQYWTLMLFAANAGMADKISLDIEAVAAAFASNKQEDGGFAEGDGANAFDTARAVQALSAYPSQQETMLNAYVWLMLRTNDYGGFDIGGTASPAATSAAMLAMDMQKKDPCFINDEAGNMLVALLMFQADGGGFLENPDTPETTQLTAQCMLALISKQRHIRKENTLFDFSDVTEKGYTPPQADDGGNNTAQPGTGQNTAGGEFDPTSLLILGGAAILVVGLCLFFIMALKKQKTKPEHSKDNDKKKKNKYTSGL